MAGEVKDLALTLGKQAQAYSDVMMPGYTHMQRAQPVLFSHHLMAYYEMLKRDIDRFEHFGKRNIYFLFLIALSSLNIMVVPLALTVYKSSIQ